MAKSPPPPPPHHYPAPPSPSSILWPEDVPCGTVISAMYALAPFLHNTLCSPVHDHISPEAPHTQREHTNSSFAAGSSPSSVPLLIRPMTRPVTHDRPCHGLCPGSSASPPNTVAGGVRVATPVPCTRTPLATPPLAPADPRYSLLSANMSAHPLFFVSPHTH